MSGELSERLQVSPQGKQGQQSGNTESRKSKISNIKSQRVGMLGLEDCIVDITATQQHMQTKATIIKRPCVHKT